MEGTGAGVCGGSERELGNREYGTKIAERDKAMGFGW